MPSPTYTLISSVTVGSGGASSIDFTSIPATYTDLVLKVSIRGSASNVDYNKISFNGSTSTFTYRSLEGSGAAAASYNGSVGAFGVQTPSTYTASTFSSIEIYIPNYAGSNNKSYSSDATTENNATTSYADLIAGLWATTSAITSISLAPVTTTSFAQYSTAYLYGLKSS